MTKQIHGWTDPATPPRGYVGYITTQIDETGEFVFTVRTNETPTGEVSHIRVPRREAVAMARAILHADWNLDEAARAERLRDAQ